ncbi:hypothetical protein BDQ17DRAFT_1359034 [Cyathus striatus]|nr:hypothetical protein BDQ17DRAFT_1359034 [Cyathus striatus]
MLRLSPGLNRRICTESHRSGFILLRSIGSLYTCKIQPGGWKTVSQLVYPLHPPNQPTKNSPSLFLLPCTSYRRARSLPHRCPPPPSPSLPLRIHVQNSSRSYPTPTSSISQPLSSITPYKLTKSIATHCNQEVIQPNTRRVFRAKWLLELPPGASVS